MAKFLKAVRPFQILHEEWRTKYSDMSLLRMSQDKYDLLRVRDKAQKQ